MNHEALRLVLDSGLRLTGLAHFCGDGRSDAGINTCRRELACSERGGRATDGDTIVVGAAGSAGQAKAKRAC